MNLPLDLAILALIALLGVWWNLRERRRDRLEETERRTRYYIPENDRGRPSLD